MATTTTKAGRWWCGDWAGRANHNWCQIMFDNIAGNMGRWEAGQKETIERDFIQIYRLLFPEAAAISNGLPIKVEEAVPAVKKLVSSTERTVPFCCGQCGLGQGGR